MLWKIGGISSLILRQPVEVAVEVLTSHTETRRNLVFVISPCPSSNDSGVQGDWRAGQQKSKTSGTPRWSEWNWTKVPAINDDRADKYGMQTEYTSKYFFAFDGKFSEPSKGSSNGEDKGILFSTSKLITPPSELLPKLFPSRSTWDTKYGTFSL